MLSRRERKCCFFFLSFYSNCLLSSFLATNFFSRVIMKQDAINLKSLFYFSMSRSLNSFFSRHMLILLSLYFMNLWFWPMRGKIHKQNRLPWYIRFHCKAKKHRKTSVLFCPKILNMDIVTLRLSDFDGNLFFLMSLFLQILWVQWLLFLKREGSFNCYFKPLCFILYIML